MLSFFSLESADDARAGRPTHELTMTVLMTPDMANFSGNVHGGTILKYLDRVPPGSVPTFGHGLDVAVPPGSVPTFGHGLDAAAINGSVHPRGSAHL